MKYAGLVVAARARTGVSNTDPTLSDPILGDLVNQANQLIASDADWPWRQVSTTFTTTAGTSGYTPPSDWLRTIALKAADERPMEYVSMTELDQQWPLSSTQGLPWQWSVYADTLQLRPIPDAAYTVTHRYVKVEPLMSAPDDAPLMPAQFHTAIVERAAWLAFRRLGQASKAAECKAAYDEWRALMMDDKRRATPPRKVRVRYGSALI